MNNQKTFLIALTALIFLITAAATASAYEELTINNETYWLVPYDQLLSNQTYVGIFYPNYTCSATGYETSKVLTSGSHHLLFTFGSQTAEAHNFASENITFVDPTEPNGTIICQNHTEINISIAEPNLDTFKFNWNGVNSTVDHTPKNDTDLTFTASAIGDWQAHTIPLNFSTGTADLVVGFSGTEGTVDVSINGNNVGSIDFTPITGDTSPKTFSNIGQHLVVGDNEIRFTVTIVASGTLDYSVVESGQWYYNTNKTGLSEGCYTYYGWANDTAGASNQTETRTYCHNCTNTAPHNIAISDIDGKANNSIVCTNQPTVAFIAYDNEQTNFSCELWVDSSAGFGINATTQNATLTQIQINQSLSDGAHNVSVNCSDATNTNVSDVWIFNISTTAPTVSISSPTGTVYATQQIPLNYTASSTFGDHACTYSIDNSPETDLPNCANTTITVSDGYKCLIVFAKTTCHAGNDTVCFSVDTTPPEVFQIAPAPGAETSDTTPDFTCNATDNVNLSSIEIFVYRKDTEALILQNLVSVSGTQNSSTWTTSPLLKGEYYWHCKAKDAAGWSVSGMDQDFTVVAAEVTPLSPQNKDAMLDETNDTIKFTFLTNYFDNLANCTLYLDGVASGTATGVSNNAQTTIYANHSIAAGTHTWNITCAVGGQSATSETRTFKLVLTPNMTDEPLVPNVVAVSCAEYNSSYNNQVVALGANLFDNSVTNNHACIRITGQNVTLDCSNHKVIYNGTNTAITRYGIYVQNSNDTKIINCWFEKFTYGINYDNSANGYLRNNTLLNNTNYGVYMYKSHNATVLQQNATDNLRGIVLSLSNNNFLTYNNITGTTNGLVSTDVNQWGIQVFNSNSTLIQNNIIQNLTNKTNGWGVVIHGVSENPVVRYNTITNSRVGGIYNDLNSNGYFEYNNISQAATYGIYAYRTNQSNIRYNNVSDTGVYGILAWVQANNNTISGNTITNSGRSIMTGNFGNGNKILNNTITNSTVWCGVLVYYNTRDNLVQGNQITGNTTWEICSYYNTTNDVIKDNNVCGRYGILVWYLVNNATIKNNTISGDCFSDRNAANYWGIGIQIGYSANNTLVENNTVSNFVRGVFEYSYAGFSQHDNIIRNNNITIPTTSQFGEWGIWSGSYSQNSLIENNYVCDRYGIVGGWSYSNNSIIRNNYVDGSCWNASNGNSGTGIQTGAYSYGGLIENNTVYNHAGWGIASYYYTANNTIRNNNVSISPTLNASSWGILSYHNSHNVLIENNNVCTRYGILAGYYYSNNTIIRNNNVDASCWNRTYGNSGTGMQMGYYSYNTTAENNNIYDYAGWGIGSYYYTANNTIRNNNISISPTLTSSSWGILSYHNSHNVLIENNNVCTRYGILAGYYYSNNTIIRNNNVDASCWNRTYGNSGTGMQMGYYSYNTTAEYNTVYNYNGWGIGSYYYTANNTIRKNKVSIPTDSTASDWGIISYYNSQNALIEDNFVCTRYGILAGWWQSNNTIARDNVVDGSCWTADTWDVGFYTGHSSDNATIENNEVKNTALGIRVYGTNDATHTRQNVIKNNNIHDIHLHGGWWGFGIYADRASNNLFEGNNIQNTSLGIYLVGGSNTATNQNNEITNNLITKSYLWDGVYLYRATNNSISGNTITKSNRHGVYLDTWTAGTNTLSGNLILSNTQNGIRLNGATLNQIDENIVCYNTLNDFQKVGTGSGTATSDNNTCGNPDGWNDFGATGCTDVCGVYVYLNSPPNATKTNNQNQNFTCNAITGNGENLSVVGLYIWNSAGGIYATDNHTISAGTTNSTEIFNVNLPDGIYLWNCKANNTAGVEGWAENNWTITIDATPPAIVLNSPNNNSNFTQCTNVLNWTASDLYPPLTCTINVDGSTSIKECANNTPCTYTTSCLADGTHNWNVTCEDSYGNSNTSETRTFTIDTTPPVVNLIAPTNNEQTSQCDISFTCNATDANGIKNITLYVWNSTGVYYSDSSQMNSIDRTVNFPIGLEGNYLWNCLAYDNFTNPNWATSNRTFGITPISLSLVAPLNNTLQSTDLTTFEWNLAVAMSSNCTIQIANDSAFTTIIDQNTSSGDTANRNYTTTLNNDGKYYWRVRCNSTCRTSGWSSVWILEINTPPPNLTFIPPTPTNNSFICQNHTEINISIAEANLDTFKFNWNGANYTFYDDSLVLGMNFNKRSSLGEDDTHTYDFSKYGNNGTVYGGAFWSATGGKYNGAFEFDGVDDYIDINPNPNFKVTFISPDTNSHQGYTTDGIFHYTFDTGTIYKRNNDSTWSVNVSNNHAAADAGINHLGDGDYYDGKLYIATVNWSGCGVGQWNTPQISIFNATDLSFIGNINVSAQEYDPAGLVVVPEDNAIYVVDYCVSDYLWKYNLTDGSYVGKVLLNPTLSHLQGITYKEGVFYVTQDADNTIHTVNYSSGVTKGVYFFGGNGNLEGVDYSQAELRVMYDGGTDEKVYFLKRINDPFKDMNESSLDITGNLTLEVWVNLKKLPSEISENYAGIYDSAEDKYILYEDRGNKKLRFKITTSDGVVRLGINETDLTKNQWLHVVGVYDSNYAKIYLNGVEKDKNSITGTISGIQRAALGRNGVNNEYYFNGSIDEVRIYNRALSADEIRMSYYSNFQKFNSTQYYFYSNITDLSEGTYTYYGWANDTAGSSGNTETRTLTVDYSAPTVTLNSPQNNTNQTSPVTFNCSVSDPNGIKNVTLNIWNSTNGLVYNETNSSGANNTNYIFTKQLDTANGYKWNCLAVDNCTGTNCPNSGMAGANWSFNVLEIDTTLPNLTFITPPTPANNSFICQNHTEINISIAEQNLNTFKFNWNTTNYTFYDDSLVLGMNFENRSSLGENDTHTYDFSKYKNNGTVYGGAFWNATGGKYNGAFEFDGVDDYIDCGNDSSLDITNAITIEAWAKDPPNWLSGWGKRIKLDIDYDNKIGAPVTHFPVTIFLKAGNGATTKVFDEVGANKQKIAFTKEDGETQLYAEIEQWDEVNKVAVIHISKSDWVIDADTSVYLYYDNDQADNTDYIGIVAGSAPATNVWNTNSKMVQHLDETSGTHYDSTSNHNNGTPQGGVTQDATGKINGADSFDGADDFINCGNDESLTSEITNKLTAEAWVYPTALAASFQDAAAQYHLSRSQGWILRTSENSNRHFTPHVSVKGWYKCDGGLIPLNKWTHILLTYDGETLKGYFNGEFVCQNTGPSGSLSMTESTTIGSRDGDSEPFPGLIDEVRIYNRSLSAEEIKASYHSGNDSLLTYGSEETPQKKIILSKGEDAYALEMSSDGSTLYGYINNNEISTSVSTPTEWHHYALTYSGSYQKLYIDGALANSSALSGAISTNTNNLTIGKLFSGTIDEVRIYNRALTADEIKMHYYSNLQKFNSTQYYFYSNITNLTQGTYTYYGWANDTAGQSNSTGTRTLTVDYSAPTVTLNLPQNNTNQTSPVTFNCSVSDPNGIKNVTLNIWNSTNGLVYNETNSSGANNTNYIFTKQLDTANGYKWNCLAVDNCTGANCPNSGMAGANWSFNVISGCNFTSTISPAAQCSYLFRQTNYTITIANNQNENKTYNLSVSDAGSGGSGFNSEWTELSQTQVVVANNSAKNITLILSANKTGVYRFKVDVVDNGSASCNYTLYGFIKLCEISASASKNVFSYNATCNNVSLSSSAGCVGNQTLNKMTVSANGTGNASVNLGGSADMNSSLVLDCVGKVANPIEINATSIEFAVNNNSCSQYLIYFANNTNMNQTGANYFGIVDNVGAGIINSTTGENPCKLGFYTYAFEPDYCNINGISSTGSASVSGQFTGTNYWWLRNDTLSTNYLQCNCNYSGLWVVGVDPYQENPAQEKNRKII